MGSKRKCRIDERVSFMLCSRRAGKDRQRREGGKERGAGVLLLPVQISRAAADDANHHPLAGPVVETVQRDGAEGLLLAEDAAIGQVVEPLGEIRAVGVGCLSVPMQSPSWI